MTDFVSNLAKRCKCRGAEKDLQNPFSSTVVTHIAWSAKIGYVTKFFQYVKKKQDVCLTGRVEISYDDDEIR